MLVRGTQLLVAALPCSAVRAFLAVKRGAELNGLCSQRRGIIHRFRAVDEGVPVQPGRLGNIAIRNDQHAVRIDEKRLRADVANILDGARCRHFDIGIWLADDQVARDLNRIHRGIDAPTDILSFPFHDMAEPGEVPDGVPMDDEDLLNLGDLVISVPYVLRVCETDAQEPIDLRRDDVDDLLRGVSAAMACEFDLQARLSLLIIHGVCHLLNYDHEIDDDFHAMVQLEDKLIGHLRQAQSMDAVSGVSA